MSEKKVPTKKVEAKVTKEEKLLSDIHELIDDILDVKEEFDKKGIFADVSSMLGDTTTILGAVIAKNLVDDGEPIIFDEFCEECCDECCEDECCECDTCTDDCCCESGDNLIPMSDNAVLALDRFIDTHFINTLKTDKDADMDYVSGVGEVHDIIKEAALDIHTERVEEIGEAMLGSLIALHGLCHDEECGCDECSDGDTCNTECDSECKCDCGNTENKEEK